MKAAKGDAQKFRVEVCSKCHRKEACEDKNDHWVESCPKFFNWKIGFVSWVDAQLDYQVEHQEEIKRDMAIWETKKKEINKIKSKEKRLAKKAEKNQKENLDA